MPSADKLGRCLVHRKGQTHTSQVLRASTRHSSYVQQYHLPFSIKVESLGVRCFVQELNLSKATPQGQLHPFVQTVGTSCLKQATNGIITFNMQALPLVLCMVAFYSDLVIDMCYLLCVTK